MSPFKPSSNGSHWTRIPIGFRIEPLSNGGLEVTLETSNEAGARPLTALHRQILRDYKEARRSVRDHNRRIAAGPELPGSPLKPTADASEGRG